MASGLWQEQRRQARGRAEEMRRWQELESARIADVRATGMSQEQRLCRQQCPFRRRSCRALVGDAAVWSDAQQRVRLASEFSLPEHASKTIMQLGNVSKQHMNRG